MHSDLTEKFVKKLKDDIKKANNGSLLDVIYIDPSILQGAVISEQITQEAYYRLLLIDYIPQEVKWILYLDTDIIVKKNLSHLFKISLETEYIAACEDIGMKQADEIRKDVFSKLRFLENDFYFNSGVILFNLELIRKKFTTDDFLNIIMNKKDMITYHDQDVLNYIFKNHVKKISESYNCRIYVYSKETRQKALEDAYLIHYGPKPWLSDKGRVFGSENFWENAIELGYIKKWIVYLIKRDFTRMKNKIARIISRGLL